MSLIVRQGGMHTTLQDRGRFGAQALGVPVSGALDTEMLWLANAFRQRPTRRRSNPAHRPGAGSRDASARLALATYGARGRWKRTAARAIAPWRSVTLRLGERAWPRLARPRALISPSRAARAGPGDGQPVDYARPDRRLRAHPGGGDRLRQRQASARPELCLPAPPRAERAAARGAGAAVECFQDGAPIFVPLDLHGRPRRRSHGLAPEIGTPHRDGY